VNLKSALAIVVLMIVSVWMVVMLAASQWLG